MNKRTIRDLPDGALSGKRVLVRVDYNVPLEDGAVSEDARIRATLPTLLHLLERDARVVLMSHLGRPKGKWNDAMSLRPVAERLGELVDVPVRVVSDVVGSDARDAAAALRGGDIVVLENLRFLPGEETNDPRLAEELAGLGDVYVNDAFGTAHRAHASTVGAAEQMRADGKPAVAGLLMEAELRFLGGALEAPEHPFVAILGGAKISGKIDVIESLLPRVDRLLIGGAMANTFFRAMGLDTGKSLVEDDRVEMARGLLDRAGDKLMLPVDCVVAPVENSYPGVGWLVAHFVADAPPRLVERQAQHWDPFLAWARRRYDVDFTVTSGIVHRPQPTATVARLAQAVRARTAFELAALAPLVTIPGSLVIALALAEGAVGLDEAWTAATLDEQWQAEQWGDDAEAARALGARCVEFEAADRFLRLLGAPGPDRLRLTPI